MNNSAHIFIDEFGNSSLNTSKDGTPSHFIYTAVVISGKSLSEARLLHRSIVDDYFQGTHIKSNKINNDEKGIQKRIRIIKALDSLDHYVYSLVIDKAKLSNLPFDYKPVFYKFFNKIFAERFKKVHEEIHLYLDKLGYPDFQRSLKAYMNSKGFERTLFSNNSFNLLNDITEEPLIQFADFYSGCIGKNFCVSHYDSRFEKIHELIKTRLFVDFYPREYVSFLGASTFKSEEFNIEIIKIAVKTADHYLENTSSDEIGYEIVSFLLSESVSNPLRLVSAKELSKKMKKLNVQANNIINEVSKLRDKGVLIVSPIGKKGYKLPCNEKEIAEFYDRFTSNIIPMLQRVGKLNQVLVEHSYGKFNILKSDSYKQLSSLIELV